MSTENFEINNISLDKQGNPKVVITPNVYQKKKIGKIYIRNLIEGIITSCIAAKFITMIPFVFRVKMIFIVCISGYLLYVNIKGYKGLSLLENISSKIKDKRNATKWHYRSVNDEKNTSIKIKGYGEAPIQVLIRKIKQIRDEYQETGKLRFK